MAHHKSAKKRIRVSAKRHLMNQAALSKIKTLVKKVRAAENKANAEVVLKEAVSFIDKSVNKKRLHRNTAARKKSALVKFVNSLKA